VETGVAKGTDLRKKFPVGQQVETKILNIADDGKIRLSMRALVTDDERATFEKYAGAATDGLAAAGFGTLAAAFSRSKPKQKKR
jgi:small subunit ribosomal protein S1